MNYFISALKKYAIFKGRSSRKEFWYFALFNVIFSIIATILDSILGTSKTLNPYGLIGGIYYLGMIIPGIAVAVRRLHDVNKSGWMYLILAIPQILLFGIIIYLGISTKMDPIAIGLFFQSINIIIYIILMLASLAGGIWMFILLIKKGTLGHNKYNLEYEQKKVEENLENNKEKFMENNEEQKEIKSDNQKITTPTAIIIAGVLIMIAILLTRGGGNTTDKTKTLSEQVGVNKDKFTQCLKDTDLKALVESTGSEAEAVMKGLPADERGTPYSVIIGQNGSKTEIRGAYPKEEIQKLIDEVKAGKVTIAYAGDIGGYKEGDHIIGNPNAPILIIEYSDLECPYCKRFGETMKEIVAESNGEVAWIYRHWIVHQGAVAKAAASECVASLKGNDSFWKYIDLVFGLMDPVEETPISEQL